MKFDRWCWYTFFSSSSLPLLQTASLIVRGCVQFVNGYMSTKMPWYVSGSGKWRFNVVDNFAFAMMSP
jgi:hypothetical protein